jgi:2-oxoisovalerate dehydrogenase E1 component
MIDELRAFLSLEAPFLLRQVKRDLAPDQLEKRLLSTIDRLYRTSPQIAASELYPQTALGDAIAWNADPLRVAVRGFFERQRIKASITTAERKLMYRTMLLTRAVDDALKRAFDRKAVKWNGFPSPQKGFRSRGQEAIVGAALRLRRPPEAGEGADYTGDIIAPLIRDLGAVLMFMPDATHPILVQAGKRGTPVGGRDLHVGDFSLGVLPPTAPLAIATQTLLGVAYSFRLRQEDRVCVSFIGEGGASLGEWHEAVNFAAAQRLPLIFVLQNNHWALGTHVTEQSRTHRFALRAAGYGIPGVTLFGNDPDEVAAGVDWAARRARRGEGPALIELVTYRRAGHAHHDDDRFHGNPEAGIPGYEFPEEAAAWKAADPVALYEDRLQAMGVLWNRDIEPIRREVDEEVRQAEMAVDTAPWPEPAEYRGRVEAPRSVPTPVPPADVSTRTMAYDEAIRDAMTEAMQEDDSVFLLGEDIGGRYGGAFGVTRGLAKRFGDERCLNTPLAESAIVGCAVGAAVMGMRPVVEMQFADFLAPAFNALVNNAAKIYWRWGRPVPMVVRLPYGAATGDHKTLLGGGPFHSQCPEMWFLRVPGWRIVAPSSPADAKGLMLAAIRDDNPVLFLESKALYGFFRTDLRQEVPLGSAVEVPLGSASVRRAGTDCTLLTYGAMTWTALDAAERLAAEGVSVEVIDLRSLWPLDEATIRASVKKTARVLILHEDTRRGGMAGELTARIADELFFFLDAPVRRVTAPDTPVPYSPPLEFDFLPKAEDVIVAVRKLVKA